jgi:hypothetical protein
MSDHTLPPDMADWPNDPHRLLGVGWEVSSRDLRRAYLRLIRIYKPEHTPEQFRRIREAYEVLLPFASSDAEAPAHTTPEPSLSTDLPPDLELVEEASSSAFDRQDEPTASSSRPEPEGEDPWELACNGNPEESRRILSDRLDSASCREVDYLQYYWLLVTHSELAPGKSPFQVLFRGLRTHRSSALLRELLNREIEADPTLALLDDFQPLLDLGASFESLPEIAGIRWRAARRLERWDVIVDDLHALRPRIAVADEDIWTQLLISAADCLVWAEGNAERTASKSIIRELASFGSNTLDLAELLFRLDYAQEIDKGLRRFCRFSILKTPLRESSFANMGDWGHHELGPYFAMLTSWGKYGPLIAGLRQLLALTWNGSPPSAAPLVRAYLTGMARNPRRSLETIDLIAKTAPAVFARLHALLEEAELAASATLPDRDDPGSVKAINDFLRRHDWWRYQRFRRKLLDFCVQELIPPAVIVGAIDGRPRYESQDGLKLADVIVADSPLIHVYRACELRLA